MAAVMAAIFFEFDVSDLSGSEAGTVLRTSQDINIVANTRTVRNTNTVPMPYRARLKPSDTSGDTDYPFNFGTLASISFFRSS